MQRENSRTWLYLCHWGQAQWGMDPWDSTLGLGEGQAPLNPAATSLSTGMAGSISNQKKMGHDCGEAGFSCLVTLALKQAGTDPRTPVPACILQ